MENSGNDLNRLAAQVLKQYDVEPQSINVIQGGTVKTVWKVKTANKFVCLKRLKQTYDKALFSVNAQNYIRQSGGKVPAVIPDKQGQPIVQYMDQLFVLYEWLDGVSLDFNNNADLLPSLQGLASFHVASKGYTPPESSRTSSKLGKWPEQYNSMKNRMVEWREISRNSSGMSHYSAYLKYIDSMIDICDLSLYLIDRSSYKALASPSSKSVVLCHQDFGKGNVLSTGSGIFVLDLDGVTFDLPARDLRKIIGKRAENKNLWEAGNIKSVLQIYTGVNPLSDEEKEVLYIDLAFPHWFFGLIKNMFQNNKLLKPSEIERIAKLEQSKLAVLNTLLKRGD